MLGRYRLLGILQTVSREQQNQQQQKMHMKVRRTRTNVRTTPLRPVRIRTILSGQPPRFTIMTQQIHITVLALETACRGVISTAN